MFSTKKSKIIGIVLLAIVATSAGVGYYFISRLRREATGCSLENAPQEIKDIAEKLNEKIDEGTLNFEEDMDDFIEFAEWVGNNCDEILEVIEDWDIALYFDISDGPDFIIMTESGVFIVESSGLGGIPVDIVLSMSTETLTRIISGDITAQAAYVPEGLIEVDGSLDDTIEFVYVLNIILATLWGQALIEIPPVQENLEITARDPSQITADGLTLFSVYDMKIDENFLATVGASQIFGSTTVIIDDEGNVIETNDDDVQWLQKFKDSETLIRGGTGFGNLNLWNYKTGETTELNIPSGHHEFDYNYMSDTYLILEEYVSNEQYNGINILYDILREYTSTGVMLWEWNSSKYIPFNETDYLSVGINETFQGAIDWLHINSFAWDKYENTVVLNSRNHDTLYKINITNAILDEDNIKLMWSAGRLGNMTVYNKGNQVVDTLFWHGHSFEQISDDKYIIFNNNHFNQSSDFFTDPYNDFSDINVMINETGRSSFVEFEIDEGLMEMRETWNWVASQDGYYFAASGGDADRLPNGNTIGLFGDNVLTRNDYYPTMITEINSTTGEIVWECTFDYQQQNTLGFWIHRVERFYPAPVVFIHNKTLDVQNQTLSLNFSVTNNVKQGFYYPAEYRIMVNDQEIYSKDITLLPNFQKTNAVINLNNISTSATKIVLEIEKMDGTVKQVYLLGNPPSTNGGDDVPTDDSIPGFPINLIFVMGLITILLTLVKVNLKYKSKK